MAVEKPEVDREALDRIFGEVLPETTRTSGTNRADPKKSPNDQIGGSRKTGRPITAEVCPE